MIKEKSKVQGKTGGGGGSKGKIAPKTGYNAVRTPLLWSIEQYTPLFCRVAREYSQSSPESPDGLQTLPSRD